MDKYDFVAGALILFLLLAIGFAMFAFRPPQFDRCDVNNDGKVTLTDLEIVKERLLELQGEWD